MLAESGRPKRVVAQAALKLTSCHAGCGAQVAYRTSPRVICSSCKPEHRREQSRAGMERHRRKAGVQQAKNTLALCLICGEEIIRKGIAKRYCKDCRPIAVARNRRLRLSANPMLRLNALIAAAVGASLKGSKAGRRWETLVGWTLADLIEHLQTLFRPRMSIANHGEWEIDHIRPLASFDFNHAEDPQFRQAWALTNLQPLWRAENRAKRARLDFTFQQ